MRIGERSLRGLLSLYFSPSGEKTGRELASEMGLKTTRYAYSYMRYWIRRGVVDRYYDLWNNHYFLTANGRAYVEELLRIAARIHKYKPTGDPVLSMLFKRMERLGARKNIHKSIVSFLYRYVRMTGRKYFRASTLDKLVELIANALEAKYSGDEILEALEELHALGIIQFNRPYALTSRGRSRISAASISFTRGFVLGAGLPAS